MKPPLTHFLCLSLLVVSCPRFDQLQLKSRLGDILSPESSYDVVEFGGGAIGFLGLALIFLAIRGIIRGISWLYYQLTKDSIENENEKKSFLKAKYTVPPVMLDEAFQAMRTKGVKVPTDLYESGNPRIAVLRPKKKQGSWIVVLMTEYHFKEGRVFKKSRQKNFGYQLAEILDADLDTVFTEKAESISLSSLIELMTEQKPEILLDGD